MSAGYIYVLVNSSMPGLVKVGKTTRDPSKRVSELSGATGVATPFVLAFKQFFDDCGTAELDVHRSLETRGNRVSTGREFFRAEADEVINLVIDAAKSSARSKGSNPLDGDDGDILLEALDDESRYPRLHPPLHGSRSWRTRMIFTMALETRSRMQLRRSRCTKMSSGLAA